MPNIQLQRAFPASATISTSNQITDEFDCLAGTATGDVVYPSPTTDRLVLSAINNTEVIPAIGIVLSKPSTLTCIVLLYGEASQTFPDVTRASTVFLRDDGGLTSTLPTTGYVQVMGFSYEDQTVFIDPQKIRVKLNP